MQFKEMGLYITGLIAMQWSVPRSSIPYIVGGTNTQADTGGNSEIGYWKNIKSFGTTYANIMNNQLWIPRFGVRMRFKETYNHQDLLEQQKIQTRLNNITFMNNELFKVKKSLSVDYLMREFDLGEDDVQEAPEPVMSPDASMFRQGLKPNQDLGAIVTGKP